MSLPADGVNANALAETTTIPTGKKLIFLDPDTNEGGIITLENLTKQILSNLATQTFNLDQGTKTLLAALNELNSKTSTYTYNPEKPTDISIPNYKAILVCYSSISTNNITGTGFAVIQSRQDTKTTGGIIEVQQLRGVTLSLVENKLLISSPTWLRITVTVL